MNLSFKIPFYAKSALIFISVFCFVYVLYIGQGIIIPIVFATIFAILLNPVVNFLIRKKLNKIFSISIVVLVTLFLCGVILYFILSRIALFSETAPQLQVKLSHTVDQFSGWLSQEFGYSRIKINEWIVESENSLIGRFANGDTLFKMGHVIVILMLIPAYLFMILFYKSLLLEFVRKLFSIEYHTTVVKVLMNSKIIIQSYLTGLVFEMIIMTILNSVALLLIGIDYAIILGFIGALLNIIPYIGGVVAVILPMLIAYITKDSLSYPLLVLIAYIITQFIDNHYISPIIVASRVKINALISVIVVLIGSALWGIPGMFLSIPLTAIAKVIFDHIDSLKPWGFLLGNIVPSSSRLSFIKINDL